MNIVFDGFAVQITGAARGIVEALASGGAMIERIAHAVLFLASGCASWITGQALPVAGSPIA